MRPIRSVAALTLSWGREYRVWLMLLRAAAASTNCFSHWLTDWRNWRRRSTRAFLPSMAAASSGLMTGAGGGVVVAGRLGSGRASLRVGL